MHRSSVSERLMPTLTPVEYYRDPAVRARVREYCGATGTGAPTCVFLAPLCPGPLTRWETAARLPPSELEHSFDAGCDLSRSMWDTASLLVHLDIDYFENVLAGDALPPRGPAFLRLEPLFRAIRYELARLELPLLDLMTGRGYHFTGRIPIRSPIVDRLADLGRPAAPRHAARPADGPDERRDHAFVGLGLVLEHLAHQLMRRASVVSAIPVVVNGTEVGRGGIGRESASIDLSYCGDLLESRRIRVAFGTYQNHIFRPDIFGPHTAASVPPLAAVPRRDRTLVWMLERGRQLAGARRLAERESVVLPDVAHGMGRLVEEYLLSPLADAHSRFYGVRPHPAAEWPSTYDACDLQSLPACVASPLLHPNDGLLKPTALQHVTRTLMSRGWHPRHIAGLVLSKYAGDFQWGDRWTRMDPARRADYDVRVFASLVETGVDEAFDFNCVSAQEKGLCPFSACGHDLRRDRERLLQQAIR